MGFLPRVRANVGEQVTTLRECLAAEGARVRFVAGVRAVVYGEETLPLELFPTYSANVSTCAVVDVVVVSVVGY